VWPQAHDPPASAFQELGVQVCFTTLGYELFFLCYHSVSFVVSSVVMYNGTVFLSGIKGSDSIFREFIYRKNFKKSK
jgi:hypothetical protein